MKQSVYHKYCGRIYFLIYEKVMCVVSYAIHSLFTSTGRGTWDIKGRNARTN